MRAGELIEVFQTYARVIVAFTIELTPGPQTKQEDGQSAPEEKFFVVIGLPVLARIRKPINPLGKKAGRSA